MAKHNFSKMLRNGDVVKPSKDAESNISTDILMAS